MSQHNVVEKVGSQCSALDFGRLLLSSSGVMVSFNWLWGLNVLLLLMVHSKLVLI